MKIRQKNASFLLSFVVIMLFFTIYIDVYSRNVSEIKPIVSALEICEPDVLEPMVEHFDWLIMIYLDGDNNLEEDAINDFNELEDGIEVGSSIAIIVLFDRIPGEDSLNDDWTGTRLFNVTSDSDATNINSELLEDWGEKNMGESNTLELFINYCFDKYTADNYWLNIWDHGGGVVGLCTDDTDSDFLTLDEMQQAIDASTTLYAQDFDLISHDACYMNMIEVAYELEEYTDYFVGSEESVPLDGFDYLTIISQLESDTSMNETTLAEIIVDSYNASYDSIYYDVALSCLNLSVFDTLIPNVNNFAGYLSLVIADGQGASIENAYFNTLILMFDYSIDFINFVEEIMADTTLMATYPDLNSAAQDLLSNLTSLVLFNYQNSYYSGDANGVTIFMPLMNFINSPDIYDYINSSVNYANIDWQTDTFWDEFLADFYSNCFGVSLAYEELLLGVSTGTQTISLGEGHLYAFEVVEEGPYDIRVNIVDGDVDLYLFNGTDLSDMAYSKLYNSIDGSIERIRGYFIPGIYIVDIIGWMYSSYNLVVNQYTLPIVEPSESITVSSGTALGDESGHYQQIVYHYFEVPITELGNYTFSLSYNSHAVNYDLFLLNKAYNLQYYSESTSSLDSITVSFSESATVIVCIFGLTGYGSFTLEIIHLTPTSETSGLTFIFSFIALLGMALTLWLFGKRKIRK